MNGPDEPPEEKTFSMSCCCIPTGDLEVSPAAFLQPLLHHPDQSLPVGSSAHSSSSCHLQPSSPHPPRASCSHAAEEEAYGAQLSRNQSAPTSSRLMETHPHSLSRSRKYGWRLRGLICCSNPVTGGWQSHKAPPLVENRFRTDISNRHGGGSPSNGVGS